MCYHTSNSIWNKWKNCHTPCVKVFSHQRQHEKELLSSKQTNLWYVAAFSLVKEKEDTMQFPRKKVSQDLTEKKARFNWDDYNFNGINRDLSEVLS